MSDSVRPHRRQPTRLPCPWDYPGKNTGVGCHFFLDGILKSRDIILPTKVHIGKTLVFPVVLYGCKSWTIKKTEHWRTDSFELWCWRRLLESLRLQGDKPVNPKGNQSWIFIGRTYAEAETQYFVHLMQRAGTLEKTLLGKIEGRRRRGWQNEMVGWHHWLNGHEFEQAPGDGEGQGSLACCSPWGHKESDTSEWLHNNNNWEKYKPQGTTLKQVWYFLGFLYIVESHVQLGTIEKTRLFTCSKWEHMNGSV